MMTAEQLYQKWRDLPESQRLHADEPVVLALCEIAAAHLAEKEREIADLQTKCRDMAVALGNQIARAEAAELREESAIAKKYEQHVDKEMEY